jgi:pectinesterase
MRFFDALPLLALLPASLASPATASHPTTTRRTTPPAGCLTVGGTKGTYATVSGAVGALSNTTLVPQCIFIYPGTYTEQVLVPALASSLDVYGSTVDTSDYKHNTVTITEAHSQMELITNDQTATFRVKTNNFRLYNVNLVNTYGEGSQAVALSAMADSGYYGCQLHGFQDTLYAMVGTQVYAKTLIVGAIDFIFGMYAKVWFEQCDIRVLENNDEDGWVTANGRAEDANDSFYVFNKCSVAAKAGEDVDDGAYYLGRPWRNHSRVVFQNSRLSEVINPAGWSVWLPDEHLTEYVYYGEYRNSGPGAKGVRANFSQQLKSPVALDRILGAGYKKQGWFDWLYL